MSYSKLILCKKIIKNKKCYIRHVYRRVVKFFVDLYQRDRTDNRPRKPELCILLLLIFFYFPMFTKFHQLCQTIFDILLVFFVNPFLGIHLSPDVPNSSICLFSSVQFKFFYQPLLLQMKKYFTFLDFHYLPHHHLLI
jgi:hypothetical protein